MVKGITRRWLVNVLSVVAGIIIVVEVMFCLLISRYYTNSVKEAAYSYAQSFGVLAVSSPDEFSNDAKNYAESFEYKNKVEIQIFDSYGNIIVTTNGFAPSYDSSIIDYNNALKSTSGYATWQGTSNQGESIAAGTYILPDLGEGSNGAYRWVISLEQVNKHIAISIVAALIVGIMILTLSAFSGLYFINSIVRPVVEVTNTARKIAMGDFNARLRVKDNDEIGELCDTINYMAAELEHAESMKNDFISSVSHELRTPLTAIRGWGETVKMSIGTDDEIVERGIDVILNESQRLSSLVEDLLDFSRMQSGKLTVNISPINIMEVLREAVYMYEELAKQQNIEIVYLEQKPSVTIMADRNRIKQVFINVIDNAIKYTQNGGHIIVSTTEEEGCIRIVVSDTGVGIAAQDIEHVKEKFYKANKTVRGSGIGLAVADEIVKQHNGLMFLESTEGVGTTVTVVLPIVEVQEEQPSAVYFPPKADSSGEIDGDEPVAVESLEQINNTILEAKKQNDASDNNE